MAYNIADLFEHAVDVVPERVALVEDGVATDGGSRTYADLEGNANRFAHHLASLGIGPGDHVGIHGLNSLAWVEAMLGCFKLRAVPVNVNYRYVENELAYLFDNADLVAVVVDDEFAPRVTRVAGGLPRLRHVLPLGGPAYEAALAAASPERDRTPRSPDDRYILYTGGTTGMPKGVVWRQQDVFMALGGGIDATTNEPVTSEYDLAAKAAATEVPLRSLCLPPLMHGTAQWTVLRFLFDGSTSVLARRFDPHGAWRAVARHGVNNLMMTGDAMGRPLIEALDELDRHPDGSPELSSLIVVASTAAVFSPPVRERFLARLPGVMLVDAIGSTETGSNGMALVAPGSPSRGGPTVAPARDAVVLDDDLREMPPGTGRVGRLARRGNIPLGYHKDEARTAATFVAGPTGERYVVAGDMATLEGDGTITLLGRGSGCINTGGEKVFPEEVEGVLKAHPGVFDALVVGVPDQRWGERVAAVVQPRRPGAGTNIDGDGDGANTGRDTSPGSAASTGTDGELSLEEVDRHCRARLAGYKVPRRLTLVDAIVRSPSGKPDYPWAKEVAVGATTPDTALPSSGAAARR